MPKRRRGPNPADVPPQLFPDPEPLGRGEAEETATITPAVLPAAQPSRVEPPDEIHLVVVSTDALPPSPAAGNGSAEVTLSTRYWHPRERQWIEQAFASLDSALNLFTELNGWRLRQRQALDRPERHELVFEAPRAAFAQASPAEVLEEEVGLSPQAAAELVERVEERVARDEDAGAS
jgi:hypothetical protein